jgi:membrane protein implicated in regulation of membrane protease activity
VSTAKRAFESTFRQVLKYTAEIIMSIILLVIICIPLAFTIPMWLQFVLLGTPLSDLTINIVGWFGYDGALWVTLLLSLISFFIGYVYIRKMNPGVTSTKDEETAVEELQISEEEEETTIAEDLVEDEIADDDQEDDEEDRLDLDDVEDALEDIEDDEEESEGED